MDGLKILAQARELGLADNDITTITALIEETNKNIYTSSNKNLKDLYGEDQDPTKKKYKSLKDFEESKKEIQAKIKEAKKEILKANLTIPNHDKRRAAIKEAKKKIELYQKHLKSIEYSIEKFKSKTEGATQTAEKKLAQIQESIQTQLATKKVLDKLAKIMPKMPPSALNDPKYAPLIDFYNTNANLIPSLDNPLPAVPKEIEALMLEIKLDKIERTVVGVAKVVNRTFTAATEKTKEVLRDAKNAAIKALDDWKKYRTSR